MIIPIRFVKIQIFIISVYTQSFSIIYLFFFSNNSIMVKNVVTPSCSRSDVHNAVEFGRLDVYSTRSDVMAISHN